MLTVAASHPGAVELLLQLAGVQHRDQRGGGIRSDALRWDSIPHRQIVQHSASPYNFAHLSWLVE